MEKLPHHIIMEILSRLPAKSLVRFKSVSKLWLSSISTPQFVRKHLDQAIKDEENHQRILLNHPILCSLNPENVNEPNRPIHFQFPGRELRIVGSCHGLLCLSLAMSGAFFLLNPTTRKSRLLPPPPTYDFYYPEGVVYYGFGYDLGSDDYKVVRWVCVVDEKMGSQESTVEVFSVRRNSWRTIQDSHCYYQPDFRRGIFLNGALHWSASSSETELEDVRFLLLSFDLEEEKFRVLPQPGNELDPNNSDLFTLGVLKGCLACTKTNSDGGSSVWIMKEYNVKESWTKVFDICPNEEIPFSSAASLLPVCCKKNGEIVMHNSGKQFLLLNPEAMSIEWCPIAESNNKYCQVVAYLETLVSPFRAL